MAPLAMHSSDLPSSDPVSDRKVPGSEKKNIKKGGDFLDLVVKYGLGEEAFADTFDGATGLWQKVRTVIGKVAVGLDGKVTTGWAKLPLAKKVSIISTLHKAAPWLHAFEDCWAAEWLLSKAINHRVTERNRRANKKRHEEMMLKFTQLTAHNPSSSPPLPSSPPPSPPPDLTTPDLTPPDLVTTTTPVLIPITVFQNLDSTTYHEPTNSAVAGAA